jgi:hypothetical protein
MKITIVDETKTFDKKVIEEVQKRLQETFGRLSNKKGNKNDKRK